MTARLTTVPLLALDAVVLDTETTGLDTRSARLLQIGAVRIVGGRLDPDARFETLVATGEPVPPASTRVHGIDDAMLAGAPRFAEVADPFAAFVGERVVIGHAIGFDLAILKREHERAGRPWRRPRTLDTRLLALIAAPDLHDQSLETVAGRLGVEIEGRHTALGDALATAAVFLRLVPLLRERGIRTLGEAERATTRLTSAIESEVRAGWVEPSAPGGLGDQVLARLDSYPYRHRIADVMSSPVRTVRSDASLARALKSMVDGRISSLFVTDSADETPPAAALAIVTERDVMRALAAGGPPALDRPVGDFASRPVATVPAEAFVYRAIGRMSRLGVRHLGVVDDLDRLVGALTSRDLLKLRSGTAIALGDEIDVAADEPALARAFAKLPALAGSLLAEDVPVGEITAVNAREIGALTRRAALLAEERMRADGLGGPPCRYAVVVLGSGGRGESLLSADQDNAIVFERGAPDGPEDRWFADLGDRFARILDAAGLPLCKGGVMARNPGFRGSPETWRERVDGWVRRSDPADLLAVDISFDLRVVHGDGALVREVTEAMYASAGASLPFLKLLVAELANFSPPLTLFGRIRTEDGRVDVKRGGFFAIVAAARALAIRHGILDRGTRARLVRLAERGIGGSSELLGLSDAYDVLQRAVLVQQLADLGAGLPPGNGVDPARLTSSERDALKAALSRLTNVPMLTRELLV